VSITNTMAANPYVDEAGPRTARSDLHPLTKILVRIVWLLTPRGLSPNLERLWAKAMAWVMFFAVAALAGVLIAGAFSISLAPHSSGMLKWPGLIYAGLLGWAAVRFFPQVWQNRRDDKFAVAFVAFLIFLCAMGIWRVLAS
jgi:hypothetical protein